MDEFELYEHWAGKPKVWVRKSHKGLHREHCLCHVCDKFSPGLPEQNCPRANLLFAVCIALGMTTPVWECPAFVSSKEPRKEGA